VRGKVTYIAFFPCTGDPVFGSEIDMRSAAYRVRGANAGGRAGVAYPSCMPEVGQRAPDFTLPDAEARPVALAELLSRGPLILYFYPKDETMGCTVEACAFRDAHDEFVGIGAQVVGVSRDSPASHARFAAHHRLPFTLLSDETGEVHKRYGVGGLLAFIERVTFVIDRDGIVRHRFDSKLRWRAHVTTALSGLRQVSSASTIR
jgi:peroxiredoxin Q/BCP